MYTAPVLQVEPAPTAALYGEFQIAFEWFNAELFGGRLRPVLITLKTKPRSFGHYAADRFAHIGNRHVEPPTADEIAMNPVAMMSRPLHETLSTLVHEMVHLEQQQFGKPGKGAHHNKQWGEMMERIGLVPSATGAPGGKRTGNKMSHYIVENGPFFQSCAKLMLSGFKLTWGDQGAYDKAGASAKQGKRVKYVCPLCEQAAWAKHEAKLICGECSDEEQLVRMEAND